VHIGVNVEEGGANIGLPDTFNAMSSSTVIIPTTTSTEQLGPGPLIGYPYDYTVSSNLTGLNCKAKDITEMNLTINYMVNSN
jgi:hypothetical protein